MTTTGRITRNSARTGIADTLLGFAADTQQTAPAQGPSRQHSRPPSDIVLIPEINPTEGAQPRRTPTPIEQGNAPDPDPDRGDPDQNDDPDPDHDPDDGSTSSSDTDSTASEPNLARSLRMLANKISAISAPPKTSSIKPRNPDVFDGTDPNKLDTFIFQLSMYVAGRSFDFPDEASRVTFALSYLKGTPLDWFQTELNHTMNHGGKFPAWFTSYPKFVVELKRLFGPRDPVNDAMTALESLRYKDSAKATRYTLEFNRHSRRTGWNEAALARMYYKGLPDRLKDEIARVGRPDDLLDLQDLVATLDQRYWERQSEITRDKKPSSSTNHSKPSDNRSDNRADHRQGNAQASGSKPNNQAQQSKDKDQKKPHSSNNSSSSSKPANKSTSISDVLGPDGKLKPEERQRRMDNKLCLRCGRAGHVVNDCTVASKPKPKGRAATVAPAKTTDEKTESGKG
jgi:hypothetical protein